MFFRDPSPELTTENEALITNQTKPFYKSWGLTKFKFSYIKHKKGNT